MSRAVFNATVVPEIVRLIAEKYNIDEKTALHDFYHSYTAECLNDPETGLFGQSPLYIFSIYVREMTDNWDFW